MLEEVHDLGSESGGRSGDEGDGYRDIESARAGAARVEIKNAVAVLLRRSMGVSGYDRSHTCGFGTYVEVGNGVNKVEEVAAELDEFGGGETGTRAMGIDVAPDGGDGGDQP